MAGVSIDKKTMYNYVLTMRLAALAIDIIGREKVFDSLILNEGIFKDEYNKGLEYDEWKIISKLVDGFYDKYMDFNKMFLEVNKYNQKLNSFAKRRSRRYF